jgi:hypothetical protein
MTELSECAYSEASAFIAEVIGAKKQRGPLEPLWAIAVGSTWGYSMTQNVADALHKDIMGRSPSDADWLIFGRVASARSLLPRKKRQPFYEKTLQRMESALRVYRDLQSIRESDPEDFREEVVHLFKELVEDFPVIG